MREFRSTLWDMVGLFIYPCLVLADTFISTVGQYVLSFYRVLERYLVYHFDFKGQRFDTKPLYTERYLHWFRRFKVMLPSRIRQYNATWTARFQDVMTPGRIAWPQ